MVTDILSMPFTIKMRMGIEDKNPTAIKLVEQIRSWRRVPVVTVSAISAPLPPHLLFTHTYTHTISALVHVPCLCMHSAGKAAYVHLCVPCAGARTVPPAAVLPQGGLGVHRPVCGGGPCGPG
jgi:hypothetical protein